jgi:hypothetical protein
VDPLPVCLAGIATVIDAAISAIVVHEKVLALTVSPGLGTGRTLGSLLPLTIFQVLKFRLVQAHSFVGFDGFGIRD